MVVELQTRSQATSRLRFSITSVKPLEIFKDTSGQFPNVFIYCIIFQRF